MAIDPKQFSQHSSDIDELKKKQKTFEIVNMGIIIVLFLGFLGVSFALGSMLVDGYRSKEASYTSLVQTIDQQTIELNLLNKQLKNQKSDSQMPIPTIIVVPK